MKTWIGVESFEAMRGRKLERAGKLDGGERIAPERRIMFETPEAMLACLTPQRTRLCETAHEKPRSVTELAAVLGRDRRAVHRDVKILHSMGLLRLRASVNSRHGRLQMVETTARRFCLIANL